MRPAWATLAIAFILFGCIGVPPFMPGPDGAEPTGEVNVSVEEPTDYTYDVLIKNISTYPDPIHIGEDYTVKAIVQIYGRYLPSRIHLNFIDGNQTLYDEEIENPGPIEYVQFEMHADDDSQRNLRAEVQSLDPLHPEPEENLENNIMRRTLIYKHIGYYAVFDWHEKWYYDIVSHVIFQAQAFQLDHTTDIHKIGLYIKAQTPPPPDTYLTVQIADSTGENAGVGEVIATSKIPIEGMENELSWRHAYFENLTLSPGRYWIIAKIEDSTYGIEWARAMGNPYGEFMDTQVFNLGDWANWEYKDYDFAFRIS